MRIEFSIPRATVLHHSTQPRDAKTASFGMECSIFNSYNLDLDEGDIESTTAPTTTQDYGKTRGHKEHKKRVSDDFLIERLLQRLALRQKREVVAHGVEMLLVIDHVIYNE